MRMTKKSWNGWASTGLVAALLMGGLTGCSEETTPGGPGAATTTTEGEPAEPEATFTLTMPTGATNVEQGASEVISIGIDRGEQFGEDVTVTFMPPQGVTIEPSEAIIPAGQDEVEVTVHVDATATPGEKLIQVSGKGGSGPAATGELKIEVTQSDATDDTDTIAPPVTPTPVAPDVNAPDATTPPPATEDPAAPDDALNPEGGAPQPETSEDVE